MSNYMKSQVTFSKNLVQGPLITYMGSCTNERKLNNIKITKSQLKFFSYISAKKWYEVTN